MPHAYVNILGHDSQGRPFYNVQCDTCRVVCNSGHHYRWYSSAEQMAERHDQANHCEAF